ncbi:hypothetical protein GCM10010211_71880 [Streptomyces albospinus]|uniref:Uncharacterized protein n=1 Tax=Streptomyces albospinus TaxID=285515 RepID=A0ABQ2VMF4_9ACTN|nr:hypothetical protein GCM10010211_71880 [Streptomyces albospinus]
MLSSRETRLWECSEVKDAVIGSAGVAVKAAEVLASAASDEQPATVTPGGTGIGGPTARGRWAVDDAGRRNRLLGRSTHWFTPIGSGAVLQAMNGTASTAGDPGPAVAGVEALWEQWAARVPPGGADRADSAGTPVHQDFWAVRPGWHLHKQLSHGRSATSQADVKHRMHRIRRHNPPDAKARTARPLRRKDGGPDHRTR